MPTTLSFEAVTIPFQSGEVGFNDFNLVVLNVDWNNWILRLVNVYLHRARTKAEAVTLGFSLNGAELSLNSVNSENLRNH